LPSTLLRWLSLCPSLIVVRLLNSIPTCPSSVLTDNELFAPLNFGVFSVDGLPKTR
jgi:hypothetical protein